jgi:hypothetical protein
MLATRSATDRVTAGSSLRVSSSCTTPVSSAHTSRACVMDSCAAASLSASSAAQLMTRRTAAVRLLCPTPSRCSDLKASARSLLCRAPIAKTPSPRAERARIVNVCPLQLVTKVNEQRLSDAARAPRGAQRGVARANVRDLPRQDAREQPHHLWVWTRRGASRRPRRAAPTSAPPRRPRESTRGARPRRWASLGARPSSRRGVRAARCDSRRRS